MFEKERRQIELERENKSKGADAVFAALLEKPTEYAGATTNFHNETDLLMLELAGSSSASKPMSPPGAKKINVNSLFGAAASPSSASNTTSSAASFTIGTGTGAGGINLGSISAGMSVSEPEIWSQRLGVGFSGLGMTLSTSMGSPSEKKPLSASDEDFDDFSGLIEKMVFDGDLDERLGLDVGSSNLSGILGGADTTSASASASTSLTPRPQQSTAMGSRLDVSSLFSGAKARNDAAGMSSPGGAGSGTETGMATPESSNAKSAKSFDVLSKLGFEADSASSPQRPMPPRQDMSPHPQAYMHAQSPPMYMQPMGPGGAPRMMPYGSPPVHYAGPPHGVPPYGSPMHPPPWMGPPHSPAYPPHPHMQHPHAHNMQQPPYPPPQYHHPRGMPAPLPGQPHHPVPGGAGMMSPPPPQGGAGRQPQQAHPHPLPQPQASPFAFHGPSTGRGTKTPSPQQSHGTPAAANNGGFASIQAAGSSGSKGLSGNPNMSASSRLQLMKMLKLPMANKVAAASAGAVTVPAEESGGSPAFVIADGTPATADQTDKTPGGTGSHSGSSGDNDGSKKGAASPSVPTPAPTPALAPAPTLQRINVSDLFKAKTNTPK